MTITEGEIANGADVALTMFANDATELCIFGDVAVDLDGTAPFNTVTHHSDNLSDCTTNGWWQTYRTAQAAQDMGGINVAVCCAGVGWPKRMVGKDGPMPGTSSARSSRSTSSARCWCARRRRP